MEKRKQSPKITATMIACAKRDGMKTIQDFKDYFIGWYASQKTTGKSLYGYTYTETTMTQFFKAWIEKEKNKRLLLDSRETKQEEKRDV